MNDSDYIPAEWQHRYVAWRVSRGGELDAIAHAVKDERIWRLICELMESAVQTGWDAASAEPAPERELTASGAR